MSSSERLNTDVWSVSRLNQTVRKTLESEPFFKNIRVEGEIFNLTYHSSGHIYFSLKDESSVISCTFFRNANLKFSNFKMREGMQIIVRGNISVYTPRGTYQLNISEVMLSGEGELRIKIENLKKKLHAEGLFDPAKKKRLPLLPITLGVATAPTGAAIRDIIRVARTRFPGINILLAPCLVQGDDAPNSIIEAIEALNEPFLGVDVIIAGRGGGSFEDLMAFNDENVVRAFAGSRVPIVSAVGHEIDNPISDLAADAFAPTPSSAAERTVPVIDDILDRIEDCTLRLKLSLKNNHKNGRDRLESILKSKVFLQPVSVLNIPSQNLDMIWKDFKTGLRKQNHLNRQLIQKYSTIPALFEKNISRFSKRYSIADERLRNFSPLGTLSRGYSILRDSKSEVIRNTAQTKKGDRLEVLLSKGRLEVLVEDIFEEWK